MNTSGLVSIITPSYNSSLFIVQTIESILAQTYTNWELLITDDCSTDNSVEIIEWYCQKDARIKLFLRKCNGGLGYVGIILFRKQRDSLSPFVIVMIIGCQISLKSSLLLWQRKDVFYPILPT